MEGRLGMRRSVALTAFVLLTLSLAGCATSAVDMAPDRPDQPWTPATSPDGEIVAGQRASPEQQPNASYVLPSNRDLAAIPPAASGLERSRPYSLPELIDVAQSTN